MRRRALRIVLLGLLAIGCAHGQPAPPASAPSPPTSAEVEGAVRGAVEQYRQAYEVRSLEALAPLYVQTDELRVTDQGRTLVGWTAVAADLAHTLSVNTEVKLRVTDLQILALGDGGAVATVRARRSLGDGSHVVDENGTLTLVFRRQAGSFLILSEHWSFAGI